MHGLVYVPSTQIFTSLWAVNLDAKAYRITHMSSEHTKTDIDQDPGLVVEDARPQLKKPSLYRVILLNDDYTPMEFVVQILQDVFSLDRNAATRVMLEVHTKGKGICGTFTYEIAETKVAQVAGLAQQHQHPLFCTMEES